MFVTHLEAGPVGLLAVGLIFMIIALSGRLPTRLKVGDNEAEWQQVAGEVIETMVEASPPSARAEVAMQLEESPRSAPKVAAPALSGLAYERLAMSMLYVAVDVLRTDPSLPAPVLREEPLEVDTRADALISTADGRILLIELKTSQRISSKDVLAADQRARARMPGLCAALLISRYPIHEASALMRESYTYYVIVEGREDQDELTMAIRRAFNDLAKARRSDGSKA